MKNLISIQFFGSNRFFSLLNERVKRVPAEKKTKHKLQQSNRKEETRKRPEQQTENIYHCVVIFSLFFTKINKQAM